MTYLHSDYLKTYRRSAGNMQRIKLKPGLKAMLMSVDDQPLTHKELLELDNQQTAEAADLLYVNNATPGILRVKKGTGWIYTYKGSVVKDKKHLDRIAKLVIPPAWENVWICYFANGHIQVTGIDVKGRKQYRYHALWNSLRSMTKFHRLYEFGKTLPMMRERINRDISRSELSEEKVLATVISLMEHTSIRVGNAEYEKMNGSYGLTTLKDKHVGISQGVIEFAFKGKKGVYHKISLKNKRLAKIVKACRDIPGKELFQYYDANGEHRCIDSGGVNQYIKSATQQDFTAKDFRLWAGSLHILDAFREMGQAKNVTQCKQNIVAALDIVSKKLGNTRTVCRKYYVHPGIITLYEENSLDHYLNVSPSKVATAKDGLTREEQIMMKILKNLN